MSSMSPMRRCWTRLWGHFWLLPALCTAAAFGLALLVPSLDAAFAENLPFAFAGGPDGARSLLAAITTVMITFNGVVFSITIVALQLASSQFSPQVLPTFLDSRITPAGLGVFTGTFVYALVVLRAVRGQDADAFVLQLGVTGAFSSYSPPWRCSCSTSST